MFSTIFLFELNYRLRRPSTYIYFAIFLLVGVLYGSILGDAMGAQLSSMLTGGGKNLANSPVVLHFIILGTAGIWIFPVAAFLGVPIYRDFQTESHSLFFTKPISKFGYLGGRFAGSFLMVLLVLLSLGLGLYITQFFPFVEETKYGTDHLSYYLWPYVVSVIPFAFFCSSIFFSTVALSRNQLFIYLNAIIVLVLVTGAGALAQQVENKFIAALLDPTGGQAFSNITEYWTVFERNTQLIPLAPDLLYNILIWVAIGAGILAYTFYKFEFAYESDSNRKVGRKSGFKQIGDTVTLRKVTLLKVNPEFSFGHSLSLLWMLIKREVRLILKSPIFISIISVAFLLMILTLAFPANPFETPTYPVTYRVLDVLNGMLTLFVMAIIVFYSGEMVWADRQLNVDQIYDSLPIPNWLGYLSKITALTIVIYLIMMFAMVVGISSQLIQGFFAIDMKQYFLVLFVFGMFNYLSFMLLSFFIQVVANNKYLGFFLVVGFFFLNSMILPAVGVEDRLFRFMSGGVGGYSDMNGWAPFIHRYLSFKTYWGGFTIVLAVLSLVYWVRGTETHWKPRMKVGKANFTPLTAGLIIAGLVMFVGMGSYIFYNTHVLNEFVSSKDQIRQQVDYEKKYSQYSESAQPKITAIKLDVDLFPYDLKFDAKGTYMMVNKTNQVIDTLHIGNGHEYEKFNFNFSRPAELVMEDEEMQLRMYELASPLLPGDSMTFDFDFTFAEKGFQNGSPNLQLIRNGTFIDHSYFPFLGYQRAYEILDENLRKENDLPERDRYPARTDSAALMKPLFASDADWIDFEATVSTEGDQIAVIPGYLQREWKENDRNYFHYKMDSKMVKFYNIVSARFEVMKDTWTSEEGKEVALEIYYHKGHEYNLERMMKGMKLTLDYCSKNFSPYQHRQMRMLEFPRYRTFAQSFANTIPTSEGSGFITKVEEGEVDLPMYLAGHEMGHQWWGHQVVSAPVEGFQFLIESMAQYAAMMVMEKELGYDGVKKYLKLELDRYLRDRTSERKKEMPLHLVEQQFYIQYNKGSLAMYALKDYIGEDSLNAALKRYVEAVKFQEPPFTTTIEWMDYVRPVVPDSLQYLLTDLFETITLFDNNTVDATYTQEGDKYKVNLTIACKKIRDDGTGEETEIPVNDYIDVGIFGREKVDGKWKEQTYYFQKHKITQDTTRLELWVDGEPRTAGIDPYNKLIDRKSNDNTKKVTASK